MKFREIKYRNTYLTISGLCYKHFLVWVCSFPKMMLEKGEEVLFRLKLAEWIFTDVFCGLAL